jgi:hypothetical protein
MIWQRAGRQRRAKAFTACIQARAYGRIAAAIPGQPPS